MKPKRRISDKSAPSERRRTESLIAGQNRILEMIAAGVPLARTLQTLALFIESHMPGALGSFLLLDSDGTHLRHGAAPNLPEEYWTAIDGVAIGPRAGSCGTAIYRREPVIVKDIEKDPLWTDYRALALPHGLRACWSTPIFDADRQVLGSLAIYFRKTARPTVRHWQLIELATHTAAVAIGKQRKEQVLQQNEERLRRAVSAADVGIWERNMITGELIWSERLKVIFGLLPDQGAVTVQQLLNVIHPDDRERMDRAINTMFADNSVYNEEYRIIRPDGTMRWIASSGRGDYDEAGQPLRAMGIALDITDRKEGERERARLVRDLSAQVIALRHSETEFRSMFASAAIGISLVNLHGRVLKANPALIGILGYTELELCRMTFVEFTHPDDVKADMDLYLSLVAGERDHYQLDKRYICKDGHIVWAHLTVSVVPGDEGKPRHVIGMVEDLTARKATEERVRRLNRTYQVLSNINSAIVRIHERQQLFSEACRIAVEHGQFGMAWIGELDPHTQAIKPVSWNGFEVDSTMLGKLLRSTSADRPEGKGTIGRSVRELRPVYCNDIAAAPLVGAARSEAIKGGFQSVISLPLIVGGTVIGVLVLYTKEMDFFDDEEVELLAQLAGDISFVLEYIAKEEKVNQLAYREPLTGLPNRAALQSRLAQAIDHAQIESQTLALLLMNLNNFRDINDSLGHQNGDLLLQHIARDLQNVLWGSDMVACLGGDEFAILLPRLADKADIDVVVSKIRTSLQRPVSVGGIPVNVEASLGLALYPDHGDTPDLLWQHADVALRTAKELHQTHVLYSPGIDHYDPQRLGLIGELRDAIDRSELVLYYQPKIDLATGHTVAVEALVRWQHPVHGLLFPDRFIPLAERTALINPLTAWVLATALHQGRTWHEQGLRLDVSINLSARNLQDPEMGARIMDQVRLSHFPPGCLTLEITESAIMVDPERARLVLAELQEAGLKLSMDDFGIGQSSLAYLKDLPIDTIKIDKSFVLGYRASRNATIVQTAIQLGHNLGLKVTAEGVENDEIYNAMRKLNCDLAQGYFFSKPIPPGELTDWLRNSRWKYVSP